jgi:thioredoxin reductase (NADPH)
MENVFDLIIIGAGPAGLAASIYASRYGVAHLVLGKVSGGQISETHEIDNYPGMENMSGLEFAQKWEKHAKKYGAEIRPENVIKIEKTNYGFEVETEGGEKLKAKTLLLATGMKRRKLNIPGEKIFLGKGVSYCATCDGFFFKNKTVAVVGGADSAATAALYHSGICQKVYIIYRRECLRCEPYWLKLIQKKENIEIICNNNILEFVGEQKLEKVKLDESYKNSSELILDGVFIEAGSDPDIGYAKGLGLKTDDGGFVEIKSDGATNIPGIWAAGDLTTGSDKFCQVLTAAAEGAIAVRSIFNWLKKA